MSSVIFWHRGTRFAVGVLDHGRLTFEDDRPETLAEALVALEMGLK